MPAEGELDIKITGSLPIVGVTAEMEFTIWNRGICHTSVGAVTEVNEGTGLTDPVEFIVEPSGDGSNIAEKTFSGFVGGIAGMY